MALKPCRECKKDISTSANKCPHCGSPVPSSSATIRTLLGGVLAIAVAGYVYFNFFGEGASLANLAADKSFTLLVRCTPGFSFRGSFMTTSSKGTSSTGDASGRCPANGIVTFSAFGNIVSASIQKQEERGTLALEIAQTGGPILIRSETRDPFGMVVAATP